MFKGLVTASRETKEASSSDDKSSEFVHMPERQEWKTQTSHENGNTAGKVTFAEHLALPRLNEKHVT